MNMLRLVFCAANEAGLRQSAAYSLKHETDMKKTFSSSEEALDKAKEMGLTPDQATKHITETPHGRLAFYDAAKGEIVKPDGWRPPDFRSLIKVAQTEQGRSEVSCVLEDVKGVTMAKPMIFTDDTQPTHFTFANQVGAQTDESASVESPVPDELGRTIESHLWLANLETSSGSTPPTRLGAFMSIHETHPRQLTSTEREK